VVASRLIILLARDLLFFRAFSTGLLTLSAKTGYQWSDVIVGLIIAKS
jgi:hypothetical protein